MLSIEMGTSALKDQPGLRGDSIARSPNAASKLKTILAATVIASVLLVGFKADPSMIAFARQNLVAWCIIPFDSMHRSPLERAQMLKRLGIQRLAIDWRSRDVPRFDDEIKTLQENKITI